MNRQRLVWLIGAVLGVLAVGGIWWTLQPHDRAWARVTTSGEVIFATDATYFPFAMIDANGAMFGFDIDLGRALAAQMGLTARFDQVGYDGLIGALTVRRADVVLSAFVADDSRLHEVAYSTPYFNAGTLLILPAESAPVSSGAALRWAEGRTLAAVYGSQGDVILRQWARRVVGVTPLALPDEADALQAVLNGQADGALVDSVLAYAVLQNEPGLQVSAALDNVPYVLAVHVHSRRLLDELNRALAELDRAGTLAALRAEWFGPAAADVYWAVE